ncbi:penicillin-insensitive murein endopeptidase [Bdellovibrio sp. SKB1291214]|uniref:penicillin-insensitive murein endopeptidase n=1 Tax=Bdellovibrio sp. SKB1291214 TaxID=1732569 RepID=UPI000B518530|nr:penicillin-insensitive murein endopeptidase [Bdellovibrio sp. SKB1291214]UYL09768.1 penicillin-insensitive murein endopeptidase [Bdellovibrio sp. SKB1291214]
MGRLLSSLLILGLIVSGCAPRGNNVPASVRDTAPTPEQPQIRQAGNYEVIEGATQLQGMEVAFDKGTSKITLQGKIQLKTLDSKKTLPIDIQLQGTSDIQGFAVMKPVGSVGVADMQVAAKATCLGVEADCSSNFIDIYISYEDRIYHHQVESVEDTMEMGEEPKQAEPKVTPSPGQTAQEDDESFADEDGDDGHEEMDIEEGAGQYVGDIGNDIEKVLDNPKPKAPAPKPAPSASPKAEEPKKETPKQETPKQDPPKKDTPKQDPPKKDDPKKVPPKKEEPKKDVPKADDKAKDDKKDDKKDDDKKADDKEVPVVVANPPKFDLVAKLNQAIGTVNAGSLERATDILGYQKAYPETNLKILRPDRLTHFGTIEMAYLVAKMGKYTKAIAPAHPLRMGDISKKNGGRLGAHKSHTNGLDADIAYYFKADKTMTNFASALKGGKPIGDWMMAQQWKLFKYAVSSKFVDRIFIHPTLKKSLCTYAQNQGEMDSPLAKETLRRLVSEVNHYNHFHMRVKCSESQIRCRQMADPKPGTGC